MKVFSETGKISIALNCWISSDQKSFMTITGYFITEDFYFQKVLLDFALISDIHTDEWLASVVLNMLNKHNLFYRVLEITTDNVHQSNHNTSMILDY